MQDLRNPEEPNPVGHLFDVYLDEVDNIIVNLAR